MGVRPGVDIFVETTYRGPARRDGAGMWVAEYRKKNGDPVTRQGKIYLNDSTENQVTLLLIAAAMSILTKTCSVRVFTRCEHVLNAIRNGWPRRWEEAHWMNAKGKPVGNAREWQQVTAAMKRHRCTFQSGPHGYQEAMLWELREDEGV